MLQKDLNLELGCGGGRRLGGGPRTLGEWAKQAGKGKAAAAPYHGPQKTCPTIPQLEDISIPCMGPQGPIPLKELDSPIGLRCGTWGAVPIKS